MTDKAVIEWRNAGKYLPRFMRDFHDQKDTFKALHDTVAVEKHEYAKDISWVVGQCYVIDLFLWHMARHGYVLRKSDAKLPFDDIEETNAANKERIHKLMAASIGLTPLEPKRPTE